MRNLWSNLAVAAKAVDFWALRNVSFELQPGETVGLIGANGAGKSTALKLISRVVPPSEGRVSVNGRVAALLELGTGFHPELSGRENIYLSGALVGMGREEMSRKYASIVDFAEIENFIDVQVKHYSSGMFARLAFAVSIHLEPEVLLVDEVLAVGDQEFQRKCLGRIAELQRAGITICLVSHGSDTVRDLCTRAIWFDQGRVMADGAAEVVVRRYQDRMVTREERRLANSPALDSSQRWGSHRVEITSVRLADADYHDRHVFETGEPLIVQVQYSAAGPVQSPIFGLAIHSQDGLHICGPNTSFSGLDLPVIQGAGTIEYSIPYLPLLDGLYKVSVAVHNSDDTEMFDYHDRAYPFRVLNSGGQVKERYGIMTLSGGWSHAPIGLQHPVRD